MHAVLKTVVIDSSTTIGVIIVMITIRQRIMTITISVESPMAQHSEEIFLQIFWKLFFHSTIRIVIYVAE